MAFTVVDPSTESVLREVQKTTPDDVDRALQEAARSFREWRRTSFADRGAVLRRAADLFRERADEFAGLMADEMGKPLAQGRAEAEKCAWGCEFYAERAAGYLAPEPVKTDASRSYVTFEPLGVILSIMPWNYPFWQVMRFGAPALMAGNAVILKHASNVPGCAAATEEVLREAGLPAGVFRALYLDNRSTEGLIGRPEIRAVTLTGSTRAGRAVAAKAGEMLKKTVLELGGSDAYLILADADLDRALDASVRGRMSNAGQSCISAKRLIVVEERKEEFQARLLARLQALKIGDAREEGIDMGPLAREDLRDSLHRQVTESVEAGATLLLGGAIPERRGWFYPPTLISDVTEGMPAYHEELFGPVAVIIPVRDDSEALKVANDSVFGLGGAVFTGDTVRGEEIAAKELEVGCAFVNDFVRSDPRLPFGGLKDSGHGRELGVFGIREFVNVKTVWVA